MKKTSKSRKLIGILGGMGPHSSVEFLRTIYGAVPFEREQEAPRVILHSDPSLLDRTHALHNPILTRRLEEDLSEALENLVDYGAEKLVVCCMTAHSFLSRVSPSVRAKLVSLVDITTEALKTKRTPHLLLCTSGTLKSGLFSRQNQLASVHKWIVFPERIDQEEIHEQIYRLKTSGKTDQFCEYIVELSKKYSVSNFIAGCTELHLVARNSAPKHNWTDVGIHFLDPLEIFASRAMTLFEDIEFDDNYSGFVPSVAGASGAFSLGS